MGRESAVPWHLQASTLLAFPLHLNACSHSFYSCWRWHRYLWVCWKQTLLKSFWPAVLHPGWCEKQGKSGRQSPGEREGPWGAQLWLVLPCDNDTPLSQDLPAGWRYRGCRLPEQQFLKPLSSVVYAEKLGERNKLCVGSLQGQSLSKGLPQNHSALRTVFQRNGKGYVHDNLTTVCWISNY